MSKKFYSLLAVGAMTAFSAFAATEFVGQGNVGTDTGGYPIITLVFNDEETKATVEGQTVTISYEFSGVAGKMTQEEEGWTLIDNPTENLLGKPINVTVTPYYNSELTQTAQVYLTGDKKAFVFENVPYDSQDFTITADFDFESATITRVPAEKVVTAKVINYVAVEPGNVSNPEQGIDTQNGTITIGWTAVESAEGYNVYLKKDNGANAIKAKEGETEYGKKLNKELITDPSYTFPLPESVGEYALRIETVYEGGETRMSEPVSFGVTGIEAIAADGEAVYFDAQGRRVANPENGLYIRVANGKAQKVMIR